MPRKTGGPKLKPGRQAGFNEAAARCRGKQGRLRLAAAGRQRFNEAAARCRGKRHQQRLVDHGVRASMRPRPDAAENIVRTVRQVYRQTLQ